jgi:long-chain acyl-CoA synthetase
METLAAPKGAHDWDTLRDPTMCAAFQRMAAAVPDRVALRSIGGDEQLTFSEYAARVRSIATGLAAAGVGAGDTVGIMLTNRMEFHLVDTAAMHLGATPFSIYNTNPPDDIEFLVRDARPKVIVSEAAFADRVLEVQRRVGDLEVVLVDGGQDGAVTLPELEARSAPDFDFDAAWNAVTPETVITLIYTSGTTGEPKGVEHTHGSILFNLSSIHVLAPVAPEARLVSFLPMAHIAERFISHYAQMAFGYEITSCPDPKQVGAAFGDARPTRLFAVPRIYEKIMSALQAGIAAESDAGRKQATEQALDTGLEKVRAEQAGEEISDDLAERYAAADEAVLSKIRAKVGLDQLDWVAVAAAPTPYHVLEFWHAVGVPITELWGMSECILATSNPPGAVKLGTVGYQLPGVEVELAEDGEILVRGPNLFSSYRNRPDLFAESVDADGWLHTGDVAEADEDGYLRIVDRKKELIINASGKNMSPAKIEGVLKEGSPLIGQVIVIGDARPYNVALVVLDPDAAAAWAKGHDMEGASTEEIAADDRVRQEVEEGIARANERLARVEQIKYHELLAAEWLPGGDELTPTSKLKRKPIAEKYADRIDALYAGGGAQSGA